MIEASATLSAFEGSLRSLLDFLFSLKQCIPTAAVILSALAYELVREPAVSRLCTVRVAYMVYLARLRSAVRCWLACIDFFFFYFFLFIYLFFLMYTIVNITAITKVMCKVCVC